MLTCLVAVALLAFLDANRESSNALSEFAQQQALLARSLALQLSARLTQARRDILMMEDAAARGSTVPPELSHAYEGSEGEITKGGRVWSGGRAALPLSLLTEGLSQLELPMQVLVLLRPPAGGLRATDGRTTTMPVLEAALDRRDSFVRLEPEQAHTLGLAPRTAMVGLARVDGGPLGHWDLAVASSAENLRDRERWAHWRLVLTVAAAGALVFLFGGIALRNQRRELDAEHALILARVEHAQEGRLQHAARTATLGTLAIGLAHEISTPLGVISGRAEQLRDRVRGDERAERAVASVLEQTEGIDRVIKGLLNLARGGAPHFAPVDANAVLRAAAEMTAHKFTKAGVSLELTFADADELVLGDRSLVQHALVNLLLNACEASPAGTRVSASIVRAGEEVHFAIRDEGSGISDEDARRAREPFFTTKSDAEGTGLGLAIAHEIVSSHRGTLTLGRGSPGGTVAAISLPAAAGSPQRSFDATEVPDVHSSEPRLGSMAVTA
jgi:signal transduction histidine kinase